MAAKRMIPPDEPTRALAGATALEKNKNFILLWNKLTKKLRSFNREVKHDVYDKWQDEISSSKPWSSQLWTQFKDGAYYCYCAYVLRLSRYSDFLSPMLTNTGIFLHGLKLSGESRS